MTADRAPVIGVTVPFEGLELHEHRDAIDRLWSAGYREVSTGEVNGVDAVSPLVLFAAWQPELLVSCAVVSVFTRGPGLLAMTAAALAEAAPGRARFGIGASSDRIVEDWNGVPFEKPYTNVANTLAFLRAVLTEGRAPDEVAASVGSKGFRLGRVPAQTPTLMLAALGPRMQRLAASHADGVVLNWLGPDDVGFVREEAAKVERVVDRPFEIEARVFVIPGEDSATEAAARRQIAAYLTVPVYSNFQTWLGRGDVLAPMIDAWNAGDRKRATELVPDEAISDLFITGTPEQCGAGVRRYLDAGVDVATIGLFPPRGATLSAQEQVDFLCELRSHV
jgi:probable F420-dependent oxidoreductase